MANYQQLKSGHDASAERLRLSADEGVNYEHDVLSSGDRESFLSERIRESLGSIPEPLAGAYQNPSTQRKPSAPFLDDTVHLYSWKIGYAFGLNYILGVGVLGLPKQFNNTGLILAPLMLFFVSLLSTASCLWSLDVMARAEGLVALTEKTIKEQPSIVNSRSIADESNVDMVSSSPALIRTVLSPLGTKHLAPRFRISHMRKFEVNQLCGIFLGPYAQRAYEICLLLFIFGALWSYTSVFGSAFARSVPLLFLKSVLGDLAICNVNTNHGEECKILYYIYVAIFALIVMPLSCADLTEQKYVQVSLCALRYIVVFAMVITSAGLTYSNFTLGPKGGFQWNQSIHTPHYGNNPTFNGAGIFSFLPVAAFALILQHSVPVLSQPIRNKSVLPGYFTLVTLSATVLYTMLGIVVALYFGSHTQSPCTLNWGGFEGFSEGSSPIVVFLKYLIVLFPAFDVMSAFPLNAITLGNNLVIAFLPPHLAERREYILLFRVLASGFPIICALFESNLDNILSVSGTVGILLGFGFPAALEYQSKRFCQDVTDSDSADAYITPYTNWYSDDKLLVFSMIFTFVAFIAAFYSSMKALIENGA